MPHFGTADVNLTGDISTPMSTGLNSILCYLYPIAKFFGAGTGTAVTGGNQIVNPLSDARVVELSKPKVAWGNIT